MSVDPRNDCPAPISIPHGSVVADYRDSGSVSIYSCIRGFNLRGQTTVFCDLTNRKWPANQIPECCTFMGINLDNHYFMLGATSFFVYKVKLYYCLNIKYSFSKSTFFLSLLHSVLTVVILIQKSPIDDFVM